MNHTSQQQQNIRSSSPTFQKTENINDDGFQSDNEFEEQILYKGEEDWRQLLQINNEKVDLKLHDAAKDISKKSYSLEPDMITGWAPKLPMCRPIPLTFKNCHFDALLDCYVKYATKAQKQKVILCFLGARYETTYYAWYEKQFQFPYKHLSAPKTIQITDRFCCGQHWDAQGSQFIRFDSLFEGGNLDAAFKVGDFEYDLFMRIDSNTRGHLQWFNFKMKNLIAGQTYKFNICNFQKLKSLYSRGMSPYYYSVNRFIQKNIEWTQLQASSKYRKKISKTQKILQFDSDDTNVVLSFEFTPEYENDQIQLCYCIPYNYSKLLRKIQELVIQCQGMNFIKIKKLCQSLGGLDIPEITITENVEIEEEQTNKKLRFENKKVIFITGRCHPGESNGSWMVDGLLDYLCSPCEEAAFLRKYTILKIIPMMNPDGVVIGNYRTGLSGKDFNRQFTKPDKDIFPQIYNLKEMFWKYKHIYQGDALIYLDFHGHSVKKNAFAYGPQYSIIHKNYYESRLIPKMISHKTDLFRYYSCIFKISEPKQKTGRAIFLRNLKIPFTYTIEASNGFHYNQEELRSEKFTAEKWRSLGEDIMKGIHEYIKAVRQLQKLKLIKMKERQILKSRASKVKSQKPGMHTSLGFRKSKTTVIQEHLTFADLVGNLKLKEQFDEIVKEINDPNQKQKDNASDDEISQGCSDSQDSKDDLDPEQMQALMENVKALKGHQKKKKRIKQSNTKQFKVNHSKTMYDQNFQSQNEQIILRPETSKKRMGQKQILKKYMIKKKNSICTTPSPKKQTSTAIARIVNFSFSIRPTEINLTKRMPKNQEKKPEDTSTPKMREAHTSYGDLSIGKKPKAYEYSESFKKSFLSVQKQILRRQSHKRYLVSMNNSTNHTKPKPSYLIENTKPKRFHPEYS